MKWEKALIAIILLIAYSCGKKDVENSSDSFFQSVVTRANDSLATNPQFTKELVIKSLPKAKDSLEFYEFNYLLATSCFNLTQLDSTAIYCQRILTYCQHNVESESVPRLQARAQNMLANYFNNMFAQDSAIVYYKHAYTFFTKDNDYKSVILISINLADANIAKGDYAEGVKWYRQSLLLSDSIRDGSSVFSINSGLGRAYMDLRDFQQSENYYRAAERLLEKQPLIDQYIYCNNRGNLYYYWKKYAQGLPWFKRAYALVSPGHYEFHMQLSGLNLADSYLRLNQLDSAAYYAEMGRLYFPSIQHVSAAYYNTAIRAGIALKQRDFKRSKELLASISNPEGIDYNLVSIRNKIYIDYCVKTGDYYNAYVSLLENVTLNDSLRADYTLKRASTYDMQYKLDTSLLRRDLHIAQQTGEIKGMKFRIILLIGCGIAILLLTLTTFFWLRRKKDLQLLQYKARFNQLRMQNIRNRLSPHFIFNVLNGISGDQSSDKQRNSLILLLRKSLEMADESLVMLDQELEFVRLFVELERTNLGEDFTYECLVDESIQAEIIAIPPLFLQIPVENAIKHGLKPLNGKKLLKIQVERAEKGIRVCVSDNGGGFNPGTSPSAGTSTGMKVLRETITFLNTRNQTKVQMQIKSAADAVLGGTTIELFIPEKLTI